MTGYIRTLSHSIYVYASPSPFINLVLVSQGGNLMLPPMMYHRLSSTANCSHPGSFSRQTHGKSLLIPSKLVTSTCSHCFGKPGMTSFPLSSSSNILFNSVLGPRLCIVVMCCPLTAPASSPFFFFRLPSLLRKLHLLLERSVFAVLGTAVPSLLSWLSQLFSASPSSSILTLFLTFGGEGYD